MSSFSFSHYSLVFVTFVVLCGASYAEDLIEKTCRTSAKTDPNINYDFCLASLQHVHKSHRTDLKKLGLASMKLVEANATHTHSLIKKLLKHERKRSYRKNCLEDCLELYSQAISSMKDAIKDFKSKQYSDANIKVSAAMDSPSTCEDGFEEREEVSPLSKNDKYMFQLTAIVLSIINMIHD